MRVKRTLEANACIPPREKGVNVPIRSKYALHHDACVVGSESAGSQPLQLHARWSDDDACARRYGKDLRARLYLRWISFHRRK